MIIDINKCENEKKEKVIQNFRKAECFIAVARINGKYEAYHHGMTDEQIIYAAELIKLNLFYDEETNYHSIYFEIDEG